MTDTRQFILHGNVKKSYKQSKELVSYTISYEKLAFLSNCSPKSIKDNTQEVLYITLRSLLMLDVNTMFMNFLFIAQDYTQSIINVVLYQ